MTQRRPTSPKSHSGRPRKSAPALESRDDAAPKPARLQKVLAEAGVDSRRNCEQLILDGRIEVDGQTVTELGTRVDPETQKIHVDGQLLKIPPRKYYLINKPVGVLCTNRDPAGRTRVIDLLPLVTQRVFTVGRLDRSSCGLLLVTNDGALAQQLTHPRYGVPKTYRVLVAGQPEPEVLEQLRTGIHLAEALVRAEAVRVKSMQKTATWLEIVLREGRNREIRRMLARVGHKVLELERIRVAELPIGNLQPGQYRELTPSEIASLRQASSGSKTAKQPRSAGKPPARRKPTGPGAAGTRGKPATAGRTPGGRAPVKTKGRTAAAKHKSARSAGSGGRAKQRSPGNSKRGKGSR